MTSLPVGACDVAAIKARVDAAAKSAVRDMAFDWGCPVNRGMRRHECRECVAEIAADAVYPVIEHVLLRRRSARRWSGYAPPSTPSARWCQTPTATGSARTTSTGWPVASRKSCATRRWGVQS